MKLIDLNRIVGMAKELERLNQIRNMGQNSWHYIVTISDTKLGIDWAKVDPVLEALVTSEIEAIERGLVELGVEV